MYKFNWDELKYLQAYHTTLQLANKNTDYPILKFQLIDHKVSKVKNEPLNHLNPFASKYCGIPKNYDKFEKVNKKKENLIAN